ncbi:hypothetical protein [Halocatena halophila]|uniref:hypothetical protein n=1 Tax=Halocatena halophila TaxID=2814576 RepID=UPI002ED3DD63
MSTTASNSDGFELGIDPENAFDEIVFHEPTVCSRCFCLIRRHDTYRPDTDGGVSDYAPTERLRRAYIGVKGYKTEELDEYGYRKIFEPRTFCDECGSQSGRADEQNLPRRLAVQFAANLANRLHEEGIKVNTAELKRAVALLKSKEELTGYDTEIFERATKIAIQRARRRR